MKQTFLRGTALLLAAVAMPVIIAACDDDETTGPSQTPTNIAASTAPPAAGTAGLSVQGPVVVVTDASGAPVAGAIVRFTVTAGGGSIQRPVVETDANGVASAGAWQLGVPGTNTVTASVDGLSIAFNTNSQLGAVAQVRKLAGDNQVGQRGTSLPIPLRVQVVNAGGFAVPNVQVTFAVTQGGGTINDAVQVTDASGVATSGSWTLGNVFGVHRATATAGGVVATFEAIVDPCFDREPVVVGDIVNGALAFGEELCAIAGRAAFRYRLTTANEAVNISLTSGAFDAVLNVRNNSATRLIATASQDGGTASLKLLAAPTSKTVEATSAAAGATGAFSLTVESTSPEVDDCGIVYIEIGATSPQNIGLDDCDSGGFASDDYLVYIPAGGRVTVAQQSPIDAYLFVFGPAGALLHEIDNGFLNFTEQVTFTAATEGFHLIRASSWGIVNDDVFPPWDVGPYNVSVTAVSGIAASRLPTEAEVRTAALSLRELIAAADSAPIKRATTRDKKQQ